MDHIDRKEVRAVTKLFSCTDIKVAFRAENTIRNHPKTTKPGTTEEHNKIPVCTD
jgi:hypothetical protein